MNKGLILIAVAGLALLTGCQTNYINQPSSELNVKAETTVKPVISIGEKIEGMAAVTRTCFIFINGPGKFAEGVNYGTNDYKNNSISGSIFGDTIEMAKAAAAYRACAENKADFIICPRYVISVSDYVFYKKVTAKVEGYKGVLQDVVLPEDKQENTASDIKNSLVDISQDLQGLKDNTSEMIEFQKADDNEKDLQKDVKKKDSASMKLNSKFDFDK